MASLTYEESKQKCIDAMGEEFGSIYHTLSNELAWLYIKWSEYVELFGTKPSRIDLLNQASRLFFRIVQDTLWENTLLHITRLTAKPTSCGKDNLTICRLPNYIDDEEYKTKINDLINIAVEKSDFCKDWRDRRIAHTDLSLAMCEDAEDLKPASRKKVKEVLKSISDVLNTVSELFTNSSELFECISNPNGAVSLLYVLDDGLKAQKIRDERRKAGNFLPEDNLIRDL